MTKTGAIRRRARAAMTLLLAGVLAACASLPTSSDPRPGLHANDLPDDFEKTWVVDGPIEGADPQQIVQGFVDAAVSSADNWAIAREFLSDELAEKWRPTAAVTVDLSVGDREFLAVGDIDEESSSSAVHLQLTQAATVDANGLYTAVSGTDRSAELLFELRRETDGEWRISTAPDGIVLDLDAFRAGDIFRPYALQYFDPTWTSLVPDIRWLPKRKNTVTRIVQELVSGAPSEWLVGSVRTAFSNDVELAQDAIVVEGQVATVGLTPAALSLDKTTLARMRTQLERSLVSAGVVEVRLTVHGGSLEAGLAAVASTDADNRALVELNGEFGYLVGGEIVPVPVVGEAIMAIEHEVTSVLLQENPAHAVVQTETGEIYSIAEGRVDEVDGRPRLIAPTIDPFGFTWTIPADDPSALIAWSPVLDGIGVTAFSDASAVSHLTVSRDGARLAAVVTIGSTQQVLVAGVLRDGRNAPTGLGPQVTVATVTGDVLDLVWRDGETLALLTTQADLDAGRSLIVQPVGGPSTVLSAPDDAVSLAPGNPATALRVLGGNGTLWLRSGPIWQSEESSVSVLGEAFSSE